MHAKAPTTIIATMSFNSEIMKKICTVRPAKDHIARPFGKLNAVEMARNP